MQHAPGTGAVPRTKGAHAQVVQVRPNHHHLFGQRTTTRQKRAHVLGYQRTLGNLAGHFDGKAQIAHATGLVGCFAQGEKVLPTVIQDSRTRLCGHMHHWQVHHLLQASGCCQQGVDSGIRCAWRVDQQNPNRPMGRQCIELALKARAPTPSPPSPATDAFLIERLKAQQHADLAT